MSKRFSKALSKTSVKIFSFELKLVLNRTELRNSFFQAVSNSSWANEGYLVAAKIDTDEDFRDELRRLSGSFGIGIIQLDLGNPDESEILFPSKAKSNLDWETLNKMTMNQDVVEFLNRVTKDFSSSEVRDEKYDRIYTAEEIIDFFKEKLH